MRNESRVVVACDFITMSLVISAEEIIGLTGGRLAQGMMPEGSARISFDSRRPTEGTWFMAIRGRHFDGHDFIGDAYSGGALGCIVEERTNYPIAETSFPLIAVGDTMHALKDLARGWREQLPTSFVFVSSGDREESSRVASLLEETLSKQATTRLIDLTTQTELEALISVVELDPSIEIAILNLVPNELEFVSLIAEATSPKLFILMGEPFSYLRLTSTGKEIDSSVAAVMAAMQAGSGEVITYGEGSYAIACRLKPAGMEMNSFERTVGIATEELEFAEAGSLSSHDDGVLSFDPIDLEPAELGPMDDWILSSCKKALRLKG